MANLALDLVEAGCAFIDHNGLRVGYSFGFRAGLHYGQMSAGILGRSRRFYRIFGDTVVTAARMCQHTDYGTVQVSEQVLAVSHALLPVWMASSWLCFGSDPVSPIQINTLLKDSRPLRLPGKPVNTKGKGWCVNLWHIIL